MFVYMFIYNYKHHPLKNPSYELSYEPYTETFHVTVTLVEDESLWELWFCPGMVKLSLGKCLTIKS